jgi:catechol 2,3-dioxygenase-like lactoylglutathione lyase family enzyme
MIKSMIGIALDCPDANALADFYARITGWEKEISSDEWAALRTPQNMLLVFQTVKEYVPPVWPWEEGRQQQMAHIDFLVDDLQEAVDLAIACGAAKAETQYYDTSTVMTDPAGHPFCLSTVAQ